MSGVKQLVAYSDDSSQSILDEKWRKYNNAMVSIQDAGNQNNITTNENLSREKAQRDKYAIRTSAYKTAASVEVAAAASGTGGRSLDIAMFDVGRSEALALDAVNRDVTVQFLQYDNQRQGSAMQARMAHDFRAPNTPNPATYLLGFASDVASITNKDD